MRFGALRLPVLTLALAIAHSLFAGCRKDESSDAQGGLLVEPTEDGFRLALTEAALDKPFLLDIGWMEQRPSLLSFTMNPVIVRFQKQGGSIALVEDESMAKMQRPGISSTSLIGQFEIESSESAVYKVDFNQGMRSAVQGLLNQGLAPGGTLTTSHIDQAYVKDGVLFFDQSIEVAAASEANAESLPPGQIQYVLRPYEPVADFTALEGSELFDLRHAGYFMNPGVYQNDGASPQQYAVRWDIRQPIVWSISSNTPAEVRDAVKEGILYWNKVLGQDILQVADAPEGILPNEPGYNLFQWVNADATPFAYAQFRSDPLTARLYQAYVVMPSFWYSYGISSFATKVASLQQKTPSRLPNAATRICAHRPEDMQMRETLGHLLQGGADDEAVKRSSLDLLRTVVAHEIGHTMGLRHNFGAKTHLDLSGPNYLAATDNYLKTGDAGTSVYSSSVMDYAPVLSDAAVGSQIKAGAYAGAYDQSAIAWGYSGKPTAEVDGGLFCTDEDTAMSISVECRRHVSPGQPGDVALANMKALGTRAAQILATKFLVGKAPLAGASKSPDLVPLFPDQDAADATALDLQVMNTLFEEGEDSKFVFTRKLREFKVADGLNDEAIGQAFGAYQGQLIAAAGGIKAFYAPFVPKKRADGSYSSDAMQNALAEFQRIVDQPNYRTGSSGTKVPYSFSDEDVAYMKAQAPKYFRRFEAAALTQVIGALTNANYDPNDPVGATLVKYPYAVKATDLAPLLVELGTAIILAEDAEKLTTKLGDKSVSVPKAYYDQSLRTQALTLFSHDLYMQGGKTFNEGAAAPLRAKLATRQDALVGGDATNVDKLPRDFYQEWGAVAGLISDLDQIDPPAP